MLYSEFLDLSNVSFSPTEFLILITSQVPKWSHTEPDPTLIEIDVKYFT